jgi:hypothetical protein
MEERQVRLLVVLSALVAVMGLITVFSPRDVRDGPLDAQATYPVWTWTPDQARTLNIQVGNEPPTRLTRQDREWWMQAPEHRRADRLRVEQALQSLATIAFGVPLSGSSAVELGLDPLRARIEVEVSSGRSWTLEVGDQAPVGWQTYVRTPDGALVAIAGHLELDVLLSFTAFRATEVMRFSPATMVAVELHSPNGQLRVAREGRWSWWLEGYGRADLGALDNLALSALDLRVDSFADALLPDGLVEPRHRIVVETEDGQVHEARFGDDLPMGRLVQTTYGDVGLIRPHVLGFLDQGPSDLMDRSAFPVGLGRTDRVDVSIDGRSATLERVGEAWRVTGWPPSRSAALFEAVAQAQVAVPRRGEDVPFGDMTGTVRVRVGTDRVHVVEIGQRVGDRRAIRDIGGGAVTWVPEADVGRILERLSDP